MNNRLNDFFKTMLELYRARRQEKPRLETIEMTELPRHQEPSTSPNRPNVPSRAPSSEQMMTRLSA